MSITREHILDNINGRKKYIQYKPFTTDNYFKRWNLNIFSSIEFTKEELEKRIDTEGAVDFIRRLYTIAPRTHEDNNCTFAIDLSYLLDSEIAKNRKRNFCEKKDILTDIFAVTISYPNQLESGNYTEHDSTYRTQTFLVNLDEFIVSLQNYGWSTTIGNSQAVMEEIIEKGFAGSPVFQITKSNTVNPAFERQTCDSRDIYPETRLALIKAFLLHYYPDLHLSSQEIGTPKRKQDLAEKKLITYYRRFVEKAETEAQVTHTEMDELIYSVEEFIEEGIQAASSSFASSTLQKILSIHEKIGFPLEGLSCKNLKKILDTIQPIETATFDEDEKEQLQRLAKWLSNILKTMDGKERTGNRYDYDILLTHLIEHTERHISKEKGRQHVLQQKS